MFRRKAFLHWYVACARVEGGGEWDTPLLSV
jgi:hypothetical protein